jgi:hypothetical protein
VNICGFFLKITNQNVKTIFLSVTLSAPGINSSTRILSLKKQLLITFDYELFLGSRSGSVQNCLIKPGDLLLEALSKYKISKAIFFVDTTYLLKLRSQKNENCAADFLKIKDQLIRVLKDGHYIFPHLHPHWIDAKYLEAQNQWDLSEIRHYRLSSLSDETIGELLKNSIDLIEELKKESNANYEVNAYRAGGWCIQPFLRLKSVFEKHGILHDFSVLSGFKNTNENCYYDFTKAPPDAIYRFKDDVCMKDEKGTFTEYSISCIQISPLAKLTGRVLNKFLAKTGNVNFGDGISNTLSSDKQAGSVNTKEMISIELLTRAKLPAYLRFLDAQSYMHFISHPKMISRHNINTFEKFIKYACSKYFVNTDYKVIIPANFEAKSI